MGRLNQKDAIHHATQAFMYLETADGLAKTKDGLVRYSAEITAAASLASAHFAALMKR